MTKSDGRLVHIAQYVNLIIALIYAALKYFYSTKSEYGVRAHPWQPYFQYAHIFLVPWLVFAIGYIWKPHISLKIAGKKLKNWVSGYFLILTFFLMVISGYLLQFGFFGATRDYLIISHVAISLIWSGAYIIHHIRS